ncbi:MAG: L-histidine N(alpha)-methyltransferase [Spiribacter sp.]|jgi:dimethylhistidine N-methyltransferase|nr:L-histidine N(alpha)-methyltransferase [Spiribacter sp.]MDR9488791.1 L-histidine N(alpha)-methyltransferase [Spiribacter sp.]
MSTITAPEDLQQALITALTQPSHSLSSAWLYDQHGSALFEQITQLPSYYPTRTEIEIFTDNLAAIAAAISPDCLIVELGSGSSRKTVPLLNALNRPAGYVPVDISAEYLYEAAADLAKQRPDLSIMPLVADFTTAFSLPPGLPAHRCRLGFFPGSTIGNLTATGAQALLEHCHSILGKDAAFLIGVDLDKSPDVLIPAYDDPEGVTAAFNRNLLTRINRELGLAIDSHAFAHEARYYSDPARIEMHLVATSTQTLTLAGQTYTLDAGESLHTETSHKYTIDGFAQLAKSAGWQLTQHWCDAHQRFALLLFNAANR